MKTSVRICAAFVVAVSVFACKGPDPVDGSQYDPYLNDPDSVFVPPDDQKTTTVYYQPPVTPPPAEPPCQCLSWDLYSCGFNARGYRLKDYMNSGGTPWSLVFDVFYFRTPIDKGLATTWIDARRDIGLGVQLCLGNNGAVPGAECPPECGSIIDTVNAPPSNPVVYLINMVAGECGEVPKTYLDSVSAPLGGYDIWVGNIAPGEEAWYYPDDDPTLAWFRFYDRYGFWNANYCISATFDFSGYWGNYDWNGDNDFGPTDVSVSVVESGDQEDDTYTITSVSSMDENLESQCIIYDADINAELYATAAGETWDGSKLNGVRSYLPGLNERLDSGGAVDYHFYRDISFSGPDAPMVAALSYLAAPFGGGTTSNWCKGNRYLPTPTTPYADYYPPDDKDPSPHPDPAVQSYMVGTLMQSDNMTMVVPNTTDGTMDREYYIRVHPMGDVVSWDPGCYNMVVQLGAGPGSLMPSECNGGDVHQSPLQADGSPAATFEKTPATLPFGEVPGEPAYLASPNDVDWWRLVFKPAP